MRVKSIMTWVGGRNQSFLFRRIRTAIFVPYISRYRAQLKSGLCFLSITGFPSIISWWRLISIYIGPSSPLSYLDFKQTLYSGPIQVEIKTRTIPNFLDNIIQSLAILRRRDWHDLYHTDISIPLK